MEKVAVDREVAEAVLAYAKDHVLPWIRALGVPSADCEDVAQDVLVAVFRRLHTYDPARPIRPWLHTIAFRAAKYHRKLARVRYETLTPSINIAPDPRAGAEDRLVAARTGRRVAEVLESIPPSRREVLVRYAHEEAPMAEIAEELGIPLNTAHSRLRKARVEFRVRWLRGGEAVPVSRRARPS